MEVLNFPYFKKIRFVNDPKEGIAKSKASTGELVINKFYWNKLKPEHKYYVLAHEEGHMQFNTRDEIMADDHASAKYLAAGYSITESVKALSEHLDRNNPVHIARAWAQYNRALKYDWEKNKNKKSYRADYDTPDEIREKIFKHQF